MIMAAPMLSGSDDITQIFSSLDKDLLNYDWHFFDNSVNYFLNSSPSLLNDSLYALYSLLSLQTSMLF